MGKDWRDEARSRNKEKAAKGRFKLVEGDNVIRILPNAKDPEKGRPFFEYRIHYEVGPNKRALRCGIKISGEGECWLCAKAEKLLESDSSGKRKMGEALKAREQTLFQVAYYDDNDEKMKGPVLLTLSAGGPKSLSYNILQVLSSKKRDVISPKKGYNLNIGRTGTGKNDTRYDAIVIDEESSKVPDFILNKLKTFSELVPAYDEEAQKAAYFGRDQEDNSSEEDDDKVKKTKHKHDEDEEETKEKKKKKGKKSEDEEEEESEDEEEEPEESEDEEEEPKSKKKKKSEDEEEDEETEEEDEEESEESEDEEDEKPAKKKKKKSEDEDEEEEESDSEEEEDSESEDEEEERPKKKKKKSEEEDDEEEEEDSDSEDEEEDEKPKKKKKKDADEEEEEPEEDEDEEPVKKKKKKK